MNISSASCLAAWRLSLLVQSRTCSVRMFLAFPAIFSASATLIEKHERERKEKVGLRGTRRGKEAAALDAAGAALGSFGLLAFGAAIWLLAPRSAWLALVVGSAAWFAVSIFLRSIRRWIWACR